MFKKTKDLFKYITKQELIKEVHSPINGLMRVIRVFDKPRLMVGGMIQSGGLVSSIWHKEIKKIKKKKRKIEKVLVIGLGCGDCAFALNKYYPKADIEAVEIDKKVIGIAESYFNLSKIKNLIIKIQDGIEFIKNKASDKNLFKYDLIITDVYLGKKMPEAFKTINFLKNIKKLMKSDGAVVFNHLYFGKHKKEAKKFIKRLKKVFKKVKCRRTPSNLIITLSI